jgi:hypothetical protein
MRNIDGHSSLVHAADNRATHIRQSVIDRSGASTPKSVAIIGELRNTLAQGVKAIHIRIDFEVAGILKTQNDADAIRRLGPRQIGHSIDPQKIRCASIQEIVPAGDVCERSSCNVAIREADGGMKDGDPGLFEAGKIGGSERLRMRLPLDQSRIVERQQPEHINDERRLNQFDGPGGAGWQSFAEKTKATSIDCGSGQRARCRFKETSSEEQR